MQATGHACMHACVRDLPGGGPGPGLCKSSQEGVVQEGERHERGTVNEDCGHEAPSKRKKPNSAPRIKLRSTRMCKQ